MLKLSAAEILKAVNGLNVNDHKNLQDVTISSISIDSRKVSNNSLYIPIKGDNFDGHKFIQDSFNKGALVCLTHKNIKPEKNQIVIYVKDTKSALIDLATYYRNKFHIPVIGITGSVGKTSTKDLIAATLSSKYKVHKTQGNFNNEIGLPLTIFGLNKSHDVLVVEMGMNHFGEISKLTNIAKPDIGVITNIGTSHIENLGDKKGILKAKCEIINGIKADGILIVNGDDPMLKEISPSQKLIKYGLNDTNDYTGYNIQTLNTKFITANVTGPDLNMKIKIDALGKHMIQNGLVAVAIANNLGLSIEEINRGLSTYEPDSMRMNLYKTKSKIRIINDTYNASPDSMKAAISTMLDIKNQGRRVLILGDMLEMGKHSKELHSEVGGFLAKHNNIDLLITIGNASIEIQNEAIKNGFNKNNALHYQKQENLILNIKTLLKKGDLILVKASRGLKLEKTVEEIKKGEI